ncbi:PD-(D/E)XK nuclease family protein [Candidatus Woesebacteria bacterium]|nr:MAG: PD-(D/E)XK nuclease family protein [Candidatus Woesebacteria bacterium]
MATDKYSAVWVSHSSIGDFLKCPRLYYLRNVYKDPKTNHKITLMTPPLALGQAVHEVVEGLSKLPTDIRLQVPLSKKLDVAWEKISGKKGGFQNRNEEKDYKDRAYNMLKRIEEKPGLILEKAVKIKKDLPHYYLDESENIILCGKIDWLKWNEKDDSVDIVDFKTGKNEEHEDSLQLPIYHLLVANTQGRKVSSAYYWYLDKDGEPLKMTLPPLIEAREKVLDIAKRIKLGRQINHLKCPKNGCFACRDMERVFLGEGELVNISDYNQDIYILHK